MVSFYVFRNDYWTSTMDKKIMKIDLDEGWIKVGDSK